MIYINENINNKQKLLKIYYQIMNLVFVDKYATEVQLVVNKLSFSLHL